MHEHPGLSAAFAGEDCRRMLVDHSRSCCRLVFLSPATPISVCSAAIAAREASRGRVRNGSPPFLLFLGGLHVFLASLSVSLGKRFVVGLLEGLHGRMVRRFLGKVRCRNGVIDRRKLVLNEAPMPIL